MLLARLHTEASRHDANPTVIQVGPWIGVCADEEWVTALGYDRDPWHDDSERAVPRVARAAARTVVSTRSVTHHHPPTHNGAPQPPAVNSNRAVVAFIPAP